MSLSQLPGFAQKGDKVTFEHLVHSIKMLTHEPDIEKFNKIASDLQAVICDGLKSDSNTQDLLLDIMEGLNNVCVGSHKNKAIGQGSMTYCSYITANENPRHIPGIFGVTRVYRRICRQYVTISPIFIGLPYFTD